MTEQTQKVDILLLSDAEWDKWKKDSKKALIRQILKTFIKVVIGISMAVGLVFLIMS
jgi:hypothetical protein